MNELIHHDQAVNERRGQVTQYQILLIEDDLAHAELISRSFESHNLYRLTITHTLNDAKNLLTSFSPDLIIADFRLPDGIGTYLLEQISQHKTCPVIIMTSYGDEAIAVKAMKSGAADYIVKSERTLIQLPLVAHRILREWRLIIDNQIVIEQQGRLTAIMEATPDLICIADIDGFLTYLNKAGYEMLGINSDENLKKIRLTDFHSEEDATLIMSQGIPYAIEHGIWKSETIFISKSNEKILTSQVLITHKSSQGEIDFFSTIARDIRNLRSAEEKIEYLAYYDALTGLPNRNELLRRLDNEIERVHRHKLLSALLFIDLDNFKKINDSLGHPIGDLVLKEMANRLKADVRGEDTVARLSGDEFVIILTGLSRHSLEAINQARDVTKKLNKHIAMDMHISTMTFNLTASIGISMFSTETENSHELLRFADTAMYEAKKSGKNQFEIFHKDMSTQVHRQLMLEHKMRKAYLNQEFVLYYQPKIDAITEKIHGAEALLRWKDPENNIVLPENFLNILESSALILDVGHWIQENCLKQLAFWIADGIWDTRQRLSFNISTQQFQDRGFVKTICNFLDKINIPPQCLDIEITEYSVINDIDNAVKKMRELIDKGITFSLDDFGTGYSSLSYLKHLPVSTVKIDRSFISDISKDQNDKALVTSIITISKNLGLSVVAEGVENKEQMLLLKQYQCDYLQGFYYSPPIPADEFEKLIRE